MVQNLRNMWHRADLTYQEVQTLRGIVRALTGTKNRHGRRDKE
jgi:tRNA C32,U32 (ribose-2'-O)-methylase TrmJ